MTVRFHFNSVQTFQPITDVNARINVKVEDFLARLRQDSLNYSIPQENNFKRGFFYFHKLVDFLKVPRNELRIRGMRLFFCVF